MRHLTLIAALSALALPAVADDTAVLMGVSRYDELRRVSDGTDILDAAGALRDAGYNVTTLSNGTARNMRRVMDAFTADATAGDRIVVGLSGRFATDGQRSWYLPENSNEPSPFGLGDAISIETVMQIMAQSPGQSVLVLGYPQSNFASFGPYLREGVGNLDIPQGVTVIFGDPGQVDNALSRAIAAPGEDVIDFVRNNRNLNSLGYQPQPFVMQPTDDATAPPATPTDRSVAAWNEARAANTADSYRNFLFDFPRSRFAAEARARLDDIENDPVRLAELEEQALNLTRNERRRIQRDLTLLEFNTRGVDGIFGPGTRGAVRNWQQQNGFTQTGFLNTAQINRIDAQASRRAAEIEAEEAKAREEAERLERDYWEETGERGNAAGLRAYLERYPNGIFAERARAELDELTSNNSTNNDAAQARENALNLNPVLRRLIESRLSSLGYDVGDVDGRFDRTTRRAIARYQSRSRLTSTGYVDQPTLARLLADTFGR